jgi:glycosyltransferase involved in cell wall biosynthesis
MGLPIVSTAVGAEGLSIFDGDDIVLRNEARAFADAVIDLLSNQERASIMGQAAAKHVSENFNWEAVSSRFGKCCEETIDRYYSRSVDNRISALA